MADEALVAAVLTAGVLMRMPGSGPMFGDPERDQAARAMEAVECYRSILKALRLAIQAGAVDIKSSVP